MPQSRPVGLARRCAIGYSTRDLIARSRDSLHGGMPRPTAAKRQCGPWTCSLLRLIRPFDLLEVDVASHAEEPARRDFLIIAGNMFAAVGGAAVLWPFIHQMNPDAGTQALASTEIDLKPVKEGQAITVMWRGKPVFIRNRTKEDIEKATKVATKDLPDDRARNDLLPEATPADDANRVKKGKENWLVLIGICTHLGCI